MSSGTGSSDVSHSTVYQHTIGYDAENDHSPPEIQPPMRPTHEQTLPEIVHGRFLAPFGFSFELRDNQSEEILAKRLREYLMSTVFDDVPPFLPCINCRNITVG